MRIALLILLSVMGLWLLASFPVYAAVECAPGDIKLDAADKPTAGAASSCLYGSDQPPYKVYGRPVQDIRSNIRIALNVLFGFLSIIVIIMVLYGGVTWLMAMGQEEKVTRGRDTLIWAAIGAVVIAVAWTITAFILHSAIIIRS